MTKVGDKAGLKGGEESDEESDDEGKEELNEKQVRYYFAYCFSDTSHCIVRIFDSDIEVFVYSVRFCE